MKKRACMGLLNLEWEDNRERQGTGLDTEVDFPMNNFISFEINEPFQ